MGKGNTLSVIYHSVPPRPLTYTFSDMLQTSEVGGRPRGGSRGVVVSSNAPEEYVERFKSRPTTRPAIIDFSGATVKLFKGKGARLLRNGFPPKKIVHSAATKFARNLLHEQPSFGEVDNMTTTALHLAPLSNKTPIGKGRKLSSQKVPYHASHTSKPSKTPELTRFHGLWSSASSTKSSGKSATSRSRRPIEPDPKQRLDFSSGNKCVAGDVNVAPYVEQPFPPELLAQTDDYDDLSELPPPKKILPKRELPWVFRFKVKKEMNALSRIMASKPSIVSTLAGHVV